MASLNHTVTPLADVPDIPAQTRAAREKRVQSSLHPGRTRGVASPVARGAVMSPASRQSRHASPSHKSTSNKIFATEVDFEDDGAGGTVPAPARKRLAKVEEAGYEFDEQGPTALPASVPLKIVMENTVDTLPITSKAVRRQWRKAFQSQPSKDVIQDTFWWMFCTYCHPEGAQGDAANQLFDRLSSTFARLLLSLNPHVKDPFLRHFFDALAQVVYNGLWFGFPGSRKLFNEDLKQRIINTCAEWTQGLRPHTVSHTHWNVSDTATGKEGNRRTRTRQGLGPTMFEERAASTGLDGAASRGPGTPGHATRKSRLLLNTRRRGADVVQQQSMHLYKPIVRERVTYELSHSALLKRHLTKFREAAERADEEERVAAAAARAQARARSAEARRRVRRQRGAPPLPQAPGAKAASAATAAARRRRRYRRPATTGTRLRPPVSPFVARITLTEDVGKPVVGFGGKKRPMRVTQRTRLPDIGPNTPTTFLELVDKSETTREIVKDDYLSGKTLAHREINIARKLADTEQEQLRCRQSEALSGDVHEFSNYLVSMWALAEEKNKRKGSRKTPM